MHLLFMLAIILLSARGFTMTNDCAAWINSTTSIAGAAQVSGSGNVYLNQNWEKKTSEDNHYKAALKQTGVLGGLYNLQTFDIDRATTRNNGTEMSYYKTITVSWKNGETETTKFIDNQRGCQPKSLVHSVNSTRELVWDIDMCREIKDYFVKNPDKRDLKECGEKFQGLVDIMDKYRKANGATTQTENALKAAVRYDTICERELFSRFGMTASGTALPGAGFGRRGQSQ